MNLSLKEIEILNALKAEYPKPSSIKKLALYTHRERSVIKNVLHGLKALTLLSVTDKNEVYLLKAGKEYLGVDCSDIKPLVREDSTKVTVLKAKPVGSDKHKSAVSREYKSTESSVTAIEKEAIATPAKTLPDNITQSLLSLESKLNKRVLSIDELSLKIEVLERLSQLLSDDISSVLADIAKDLIQADAA